MPHATRITWTTAAGKKRTAWQVRYKDRTSRRRCRQFPTRAEAEEFAATITSAVRSGSSVHNRDTITVAAAAERWLAACERGRNGRTPVEPWTLKVYEQFLRHHIAPALGGLLLSSLSPSRVREFRDIDMLGAGKSRYLTRKVLTALSSICSDAVADELLGVNPCKGVRLVTNKREKVEVTIPTKDQIRTIMEIAERWAYGTTAPLTPGLRGPVVFKGISRWRAMWWYTFLRMLIATGCRSSELRGASWSSLHGNKFLVKQRADVSGVIGPPKSASSWRELDLDSGTVDVIERWRPVSPKGPANLIFAGKGGGPERLSNISKRLWFPMLCEAGIAKRVRTPSGERHESPFTIHDLRHFHASLMIEAGLRDKALQEHMGHSSIKVTMDIYGHLFVDDDSRAARRLLVTGATSGLLGTTAK